MAYNKTEIEYILHVYTLKDVQHIRKYILLNCITLDLYVVSK